MESGHRPHVEMNESRVFRARALTQAHPMSAGAGRYLNKTVARERLSQPQAEIGIWAGYALTAGYCLRRVEEVDILGDTCRVATDDYETLDADATEIAGRIRTVGGEHHYLLTEGEIVADLDALIGGEIERRLEHWKDTITDDTWRELEEYIAWWVVKGYALRIAETRERE